jgi:hypothetical protein
MQSAAFPKQIYISHVKMDQQIISLADMLAEELRLRGFDVWTEKPLDPDIKWSDQIEKGLIESDAMIALLTPHSFSSAYVRNELEYAFSEKRFKNRLLPVLIGTASDEAFSRLPWVLTKLQFLRISEKKPQEEIAKTIVDSFQELLKGSA